jgi:predicted nucleic acid-binding protein
LKYYLDTSVVVAALTNEVATSRVLAWMDGQENGSLAISDWVVTELSAALSIKMRRVEIDTVHRAQALTQFHKMVGRALPLLPVEGHHFSTAADLADRYEHGLRAGDALNLAVAFDHGLTLSTLDAGQARAGIELGISTRLL